jgi:protein-S-isoprenylcysteine O-methyltransferase Ste14
LRGAAAPASLRRTPPGTAAVAEALVAAAWIAVVLDGLRLARRERAAHAALGPIRRAVATPPVLVRGALVAALVAGAARLEGLAAPPTPTPALVLVGLGFVLAGVVLHARARRALGARWSTAIAVRAGHGLVDRGPYAVVRHPLYAAVLLLAAGSVLVHPSRAVAALTAGLAAGVVLKLRLEERALRAALGADWDRYAARVPALVPRLPRRRRDAARG